MLDAIGPTVPKTLGGQGACSRVGEHGMRCEVRGDVAKVRAAFTEARSQLVGCFDDLRRARRERREQIGTQVTAEWVTLTTDQAEFELSFLAQEPIPGGKPLLLLLVAPRAVADEAPLLVCAEAQRALTDPTVTTVAGFDSCTRARGTDAGAPTLECVANVARYGSLVRQLDRCLADWEHVASAHNFGVSAAITGWSDEWKKNGLSVFAQLSSGSRQATVLFKPSVKR